MNGKQRHHEALNPQPFLDTVEKLMSSSPAVNTKKTPLKKTVRKAPVKKATVKTRTKKKATSRSA
jgi:hypothetical protein